MLGLHWVGDLMLDCELQVNKGGGKALVELVKGGRHFRCALDCQTGEAVLSIDGLDGYRPKAQTRVHGTGSHRVTFANFDNHLSLWIDGVPIEFDAPTSYPPLGNDQPQSTADEPGDLLPARIGSQSAALRVNHVRLLRDIYYIATRTSGPVADYLPPYARLTQMTYDELLDFWSTPALWAPAGQTSPFDERGESLYPLAANQFFVLGDNSPLSQDARLWQGERYVARELLVGKALYIFWPHSFDKIPGTNIPMPFFPNFARMGFIR
jgi:signal peptidase I